jgi:predicted TPR repeat methyltransferase
MLTVAASGLRRRLRWWLGRGWRAEDFAGRYAGGGADAWGYRDSVLHARRADFIMGALPKPRFEKAIEVGCAQGFLSESFAARADRLIACDLSAEAVRQARETCRRFANAEFNVADIRAGFPGEGFDLCVFSDVLYYLSGPETDAVLADAARCTQPGGFLVIVNEWAERARGLTPPRYAFAQLDANPLWKKENFLQAAMGETHISLGVYRRGP